MFNQNPSVRLPKSKVQKKLEKALSYLSPKKNELNYLFVSDREIRRYNKKFLNHDYVTDVIAFEMQEEGKLGDIVVSTDTAKRQAGEEGHSFEKELLILCLHGLLHILGYRDKSKEDQKIMWDKTYEVFDVIHS